MRHFTQQDDLLINKKFFIAHVLVVIGVFLLSFRLWYLQIYKGQYYRNLSKSNRIRKIELEAPRGLIYDKFGKLILGNKPFFDLVYIPQYIVDKKKTIDLIENLLHIPSSKIEKTLKKYQNQPRFIPIVLSRNLSQHQVSLVESQKIKLPGIEVRSVPRRSYHPDTPSHLIGYLGEIDYKTMQDLNSFIDHNYYRPGDLVGKQGLEFRWEQNLRGQRGIKYIQVDALGREAKLSEDEKDLGSLPEQRAIPGSNIVLTLDFYLQKITKKAFRGKNGAVVVMDPRNGEILSLLSSPDYDPMIYQQKISYDKWQAMLNDPFKPFFDKTSGGSFPPGSLLKPFIALSALQEGLISEKTEFKCHGAFELGKDTFHCYNRYGHGKTNLEKALMKSCDAYFYHLGLELGTQKITKYADDFFMGKRLGFALNREDSGLIPELRTTNNRNKVTFSLGDLPNMAIGQGSLLMTPLQIAVLYSAIANDGHIWLPHIVKKISSYLGEVKEEVQPQLLNKINRIDKKNFRIIRSALKTVVHHPKGTGKNAKIDGVTIAGKTGSVQVVSLNKNRNRKKSVVSMKWQEHAMFAAFSPVEKAEIVVVVISENDNVGGGSISAAPIAKEILEAYWKRKKDMQSIIKGV